MLQYQKMFHQLMVQNIQPLVLNYEGRDIDVLATIEHAFNKHATYSFKAAPCANHLSKGRQKKLHKQNFKKTLHELLLYLDDEELEIALASFPKDRIKFDEFKRWWMS